MARPARKLVWGAVALVVVLVAVLYRHYGLGDLLTLEQLRASRQALEALYQDRPVQTLAVFFAVYVVSTALSFPGAVVLTLAGATLFGFWQALLVVSFASSLGALLAFLASRYLLRDVVQERFGKRLAPVNEGMRRDGMSYLLTLRLVPLFPFWLVNLLMGLTPIRAWRYYWVSQLGMLPGTAVYVNAGTQLVALQTLADILSPALVGSFALLGLFPWMAKAAVAWLRRRRLYVRWTRPRRFDRNLVVIGAGAGGLVSAYIAAAVKARVTLVEAGRMGGDCLNTGCVPSKALIRSAEAMRQLRRAQAYGVRVGRAEVDFPAVMQRVRDVVRAIEPHDSVERYTGLGVEVLQGHARLTSPWSVEVTHADGRRQTLTTRSVVIAAGARPAVPPVPGLEQTGFLTSDTVWELAELPRRLVVLGGGPVGCELAQAFASLGSEVTLVERAACLLPAEDEAASAAVAQALSEDGVTLLTGHEAARAEQVNGENRLVLRSGMSERIVPFDRLLCAVGRTARVEGYGLEELGVPLTARGTVEVNEHLQTLYPNIFAVGDVAGPMHLTHVAAHQAWYATVNALFGRFRKFRVDERVIPRTVFTSPEVARVGLTEAEARAQGVACEVTRYDLDDLDRAIVDGKTQGFVKVLTVPGKDRILGVTIVSEHAAELLAEFTFAMRHGLGLNKILGTVHAYPTLTEASKYAAGQWRRDHAPQGLMRWLARFHDWERS